jgi:hypothetical protein
VQRRDVDPARISAHASGVAGIWLLLAAAVNPQIASVSLDRTPYSLKAAIDAPIHTNLHDAVIPEFSMRSWDLADLRGLVRDGKGRARPVRWNDPTDWMGNVIALPGDYTYSASDPNVGR